MLQTEFETLTGIYPDITLYSAIEREYTRQTDDGHDVWHDKLGMLLRKENTRNHPFAVRLNTFLQW